MKRWFFGAADFVRDGFVRIFALVKGSRMPAATKRCGLVGRQVGRASRAPPRAGRYPGLDRLDLGHLHEFTT